MNTDTMEVRRKADTHKHDKYKIEQLLNQFSIHHPFLSFWAALVGIPAMVLGTVAALATIIILPIAWLMGWPL